MSGEEISWVFAVWRLGLPCSPPVPEDASFSSNPNVPKDLSGSSTNTSVGSSNPGVETIGLPC